MIDLVCHLAYAMFGAGEEINVRYSILAMLVVVGCSTPQPEFDDVDLRDQVEEMTLEQRCAQVVTMQQGTASSNRTPMQIAIINYQKEVGEDCFQGLKLL